jgi:type I restriction enzyme S subunit
MAGEWNELPFSEAVLLNPATPLARGAVYPFVEMSAITAGTRDVKCSEHREFTGGGSRFQDRDTLMARITPCLENGKLARFLAPEGEPVGHGSTEFIVIRGRPNVTDNDYAYYLTISPEVRSFAISQMTGTSGRQRVPTDALGGITVSVPPLAEQKAIAAVLGALDDKIELNRRMNATLEAMARALFQSWFVDFDPVRAKLDGRQPPNFDPATAALFPDSFQDSELGHIPKGWRAGSLGEFMQVGIGGAWGDESPDSKQNTAVRCLRGIDCHDLAERKLPEVPIRYLSERQFADRKLTEGCVLVEGSGSFCGRSMVWLSEFERLIGSSVCYSNFCKRLDPLCSPSQALICWMQLRAANDTGELANFRTGTAFPNLDIHGALLGLHVVCPPKEICDHYMELYRSWLRLDLVHESRTLATLRDTLLPKLLSGEIKTIN